MSDRPAVVTLSVTLTIPADGLPSSTRMRPEDYALYIVQGALNNTLSGCQPQVTKVPADHQPINSKGSDNR